MPCRSFIYVPSHDIMKKAILSTAALTIACALSLCASVSPVTTSDTLSRPTLVERIANIEQKSDKFHLLLHLNGSFDGYWTNDDFTRAAFKMNQARIEAKGILLPWLSYQWRQRLNKSNTPEALDNLPASIDCAWIRVALSDDKNLTIGKQGAAYGGFEYDLDPIEIYQYSDMCDYMIFDFEVFAVRLASKAYIRKWSEFRKVGWFDIDKLPKNTYWLVPHQITCLLGTMKKRGYILD